MSGIIGNNLGRGSGLVKATAVDTAEIDDNAITLAKMAGGTDGNVISYDASGDPVAISTGSDGEVLTSTGAGSPPAFEAAAGGITAANFRPNAKPIVINGDMKVSQRGTSFAAGGEQYTLDRFRYEKSNDAVVTITQEALTADEAYEDGFSKALKVDVTTVDSSMTTNQRAHIEQKIEAQDLQLFKKGTSAAETFTLAFWVKATKTGTNVVRLFTEDSDRAVSLAYTVSSTDTWEFKVINFPADTTGVINNDNGQGLTIAWGLAVGPTYTSGSLRTTWGGGGVVSGDFVGQVNNLDSTSNNWHLTGVQLEVGTYSSSTLPPFQHESYGDNLARCQRYFVFTGDGSAYAPHGIGSEVTSTTAYVNIPLPTPMRAAPSITQRGASGTIVIHDGNSESAITSLGSVNYGKQAGLFNLQMTASGGGIDDASGITVYSSANATAGFLIDAEL